MKKTMMILLAVCLCLLLAGCRNNESVSLFGTYNYSDANRYCAGGAEVSGKTVALDISWLDGSVTIGTHKGRDVVISEEAPGRFTEETQLHWRLDGGVLYVKYAASGYRTVRGENKQLTVLLPEDMQLDKVKVSTASASVTSDVLTAETVSIQSASGRIGLGQQVQAKEIRLDTASGSIRMEAAEAAKLVLNTVSGNVNVSGDSLPQVQVDTVSGPVKLGFGQTPETVKVNSVSGSVEVTLDRSAGFTAKIDTVSGSVGGSMPVTENGKNRYVSGDGRCEISIDTVSGSVRLNAAD